MTVTFDQLLDPLEERDAELRRRAETLLAEAQDLDDRLAKQNRAKNAKESERIRALVAEAKEIDAERKKIGPRIATLQREQAEDAEMTRMAAIRTPGADAPHYERSTMTSATTRLRQEYNAERDRTGERSYFADLFQSERGDVNARARIQQFGAENRATSTGSFAGLVVPQYLIDQAALLARAGRPFANSVQSLEIPEQGIQLLLPRGTTGASAAVQSTENSSVSSTDEVWANVTLPVATIAGQANPSRQSLERGAPGVDRLVMNDLAGAYGVALDQQCLSGSGASGQVLGVLNTAGVNQATAFGAAVTATTFWTKCAGQISAVATARGIAPDTICMHPRRFAWLVSQVDSQGRPLVLPSKNGAAVNAMGLTDGPPAYGIAAGQEFMGLQVVVDANVPIAVGSGPEDQVLIYRRDDILLYEAGGGMPTELRFEQTFGNQLTITLVSYGYLAFTAARYPSAVGIVGGNSASTFGLVAPAF